MGSALTWAMRSQDPVFCSQLADEFLRGYMSTGAFQSLDLLENLGCEMMLGDRLVFLGTCIIMETFENKHSIEASL